MIAVKRALLSCYDKTGLDVFAKGLAALGVELIASGGTADFLRQQGLTVKSVETFAGIAQQLDGRVKTLHPKIHAGILARRDDPRHVQAVGADGLIDLVAVNLYPFAETIARPGITDVEAVEQIDIGGVALLRAAAKNSAYVVAVSQPEQYAIILETLRQGQGRLPEMLARELAVAAFALTASYDSQIAGHLGRGPSTPAFPEHATLRVRRRQSLRYGENPHQQGAWYVPEGESPWGLATLTQLQGKELSYNNLLDVDAALRCLLEFDEPTCVIVKHASQCGLASAATAAEAYAQAYACDAESAFGGIVGCNRPIDATLAQRLMETFLEVIVAPSIAPMAVSVFSKKTNLRVVTVEWPKGAGMRTEWRQLAGSWLLQDADRQTVDSTALRVATTRAPTEAERADLLFAWKAVKHARSNGIVLAHRQASVGIVSVAR
jgi:phosphoribosylaminoimidazolecarboxamide formyltransferase/IMP cyclohydrolase